MKFRLEEHGDVARAAKRATRPRLIELGRAILEDAQRASPVRTGHLRASGETEPGVGDSVVVGFMAHYAAFVSEGTSRQAPNPFFKSAIYRSANRLAGGKK